MNCEEQFERGIERAIDAVDARLMAGNLSQIEYDAEMKRISQREKEFYSRLTARRF